MKCDNNSCSPDRSKTGSAAYEKKDRSQIRREILVLLCSGENRDLPDRGSFIQKISIQWRAAISKKKRRRDSDYSKPGQKHCEKDSLSGISSCSEKDKTITDTPILSHAAERSAFTGASATGSVRNYSPGCLSLCQIRSEEDTASV